MPRRDVTLADKIALLLLDLLLWIGIQTLVIIDMLLCMLIVIHKLLLVIWKF
jgi:hypothetical protein